MTGVAPADALTEPCTVFVDATGAVPSSAGADGSTERFASSAASQWAEEKHDWLIPEFRPEPTPTPQEAHGFAGPASTRTAPSDVLSSPLPNRETQKILRAHYVNSILADLRRVRDTAGQPSSAAYMLGLRTGIRAMASISPDDPFVEVLLAFHDAISYRRAAWADHSQQQYAAAYKLFSKLAAQPCNDNVVGRALCEMEGMGFNVTPFPFDFENAGEYE